MCFRNPKYGTKRAYLKVCGLCIHGLQSLDAKIGEERKVPKKPYSFRYYLLSFFAKVQCNKTELTIYITGKYRYYLIIYEFHDGRYPLYFVQIQIGHDI